MVTHISQRQTQFFYFDQVLDHPVWKGSKILDFGGNVGGFLAGAGDCVDHDDYWCLDVTKAAVEQGQQSFPRAHFVHFNRYSSYFNPDGIPYLPVPDLGLRFDIIMAFSVFTHTHRNEMIELVRQLRSQLGAGGLLAFTFYDPSYDQSSSDPTLPPGSMIYLFANAADDSQGKLRLGWSVIVDGEFVVEPGKEFCQQKRRGRPGESYTSYFTVRYMASLFPDATIRRPVAPETQHCCVLRNTEHSRT